MKYFLVKLNLQIGECEKHNTWLVIAKNEKSAIKKAFTFECHGDSVFLENEVSDMHGDYIYSLNNCVEITPEHSKILEIYMCAYK